MVKDSAGQERPIKVGPKLWVSCSNFDAIVRLMSRLYQTVCACQGKSTAADLYTATKTCGSSVMTHTSRLQLFASLGGERAHFGQGVYATQHEPADARLNVMYLANLEPGI